MHFANLSFTLLPLCLFHSQLTPLENALKTPKWLSSTSTEGDDFVFYVHVDK